MKSKATAVKAQSRDMKLYCKHCKRKLTVTEIDIPSRSKLARAVASALGKEKKSKK